MKNGLLIFISGIVIGCAAMMVFETSQKLIEVEIGNTTRRAVMKPDNAGMARGSVERRVRNNERFSLEGDAVDRVIRYLEALAESKNGRDLNYLEAMRQGAIIGEFSIVEAQEFLLLMEAKVRENPKLESFTKIVTRLAFMRWCELDGAGALAELMTMENMTIKKDGRDGLAEAGIQAWTAADPEGARAWIVESLGKIDELVEVGRGLERIEGPHRLMSGGDFYKFFLENYIDQKGEEVFGVLDAVQNEQIRSSLRDNIVESLAEREENPSKLKILLEMTQPGEFGGQREVLRKLVVKSPEEARRWTEGQAPSRERDQFIAMIAEPWLKRAPEAAATWYLAQELVQEGRDQDRYSRIFGAWRQKDLAEANQWLLSQPDTASRDTAESLAANSAVGQREYVQALEWVAGIQSEGLKMQAFYRVIQNTKRLENGELPKSMVQAAGALGFELKE